MTTIEHVVVKTLVSLPHATPSVTLAKPRKTTIVYTLSISSQGGAKDSQEEIDLGEVITIPKFDLDNLFLDQIQIMQHSFHRKTKQEQKRRELRQQEVLHDIKDIFVESFDIANVNVDQTIREQLVHNVDEI